MELSSYELSDMDNVMVTETLQHRVKSLQVAGRL